MSSKQIGEPTEEINILLRRTAVPKCDITPAVKGLMAQCKQDMYMNHSTVTYHKLNTTGINHNMYHKIAHYHSYLHHVSRACAPSSSFSFAHTHTHTHTRTHTHTPSYTHTHTLTHTHRYHPTNQPTNQ